MNIAKARQNPYDNLPADMVIFDAQSLYEVELMAKGMSEEEVLAYYTLGTEDLPAKSSDWIWFHKAFKRGRSHAKHKAVNDLFQAMQGRQAKEASIAYLQRFGQLWPEASEQDGNDKKNFSFTVVLDD